jgi:aquaporin Z
MNMRNEKQLEDRRYAAAEALPAEILLQARQASRPSSTGDSKASPVLQTAKQHWPEYLMEAFGLGLFMISACSFGTLLSYAASPVHQAIAEPLLRRLLMGTLMGLTAILNIYSPWGKRSGAHLNPSTTLAFFRLGKVKGIDAACYAAAQFFGGAIGVWLASAVIGNPLAHPSVNYVATLPGAYGLAAAFVAEVLITFILISVVLRVANNPGTGRFTGIIAGLLVAIYITIEDPFSGMSMNPARTLASALFAHTWSSLWLYFLAPPVGMLLAAEVYLRFDGKQNDGCAKLHHQNKQRCIHCGFNMKGSNA